MKFSGYSTGLRGALRAIIHAIITAVCLYATRASADGPYILPAAQEAWEAWATSTGKGVERTPSKIGDVLTVRAVGNLSPFTVQLRKPESIVSDELPWPDKVPVFVVADTHGEFEIATELLRRNHVIDAGFKWSFGKGRLIVLGDVFDRGPNQTELFWLFYQLETEAAKAGGGVHLRPHEIIT